MSEPHTDQTAAIALLQRDLLHMRVIYGVSLIIVILIITGAVPLLAPDLANTWNSKSQAAQYPSVMTNMKGAEGNMPPHHSAPAATSTRATATSTP